MAASSRSECQEIPRHFWKAKVSSRCSPQHTLNHTPSQLNPVHNITPYLLSEISCNITLTSTPISPNFLPSGFPTKILIAFLIYATRTL
jgi:hypothetical protein